jgi:glycosyltransferase involved in cell wall biosynthesis
MSKILLIGYQPPQLLKNSKVEAAHYRTWQFLQPLIDDGHQVLLCADHRGDPLTDEMIPAPWREQLRYEPIPLGKGGWMVQLQRAHDAFQPNAIVAVNFYQCLYATRLQTTRPLWMDIYGDMPTIMQALCYRQGHDRGLGITLHYVRQVMGAGDLFSGCGTPQKHAMVGQLALAGRLNHRTFGYDFTRVVLPGAPPSSQVPNFQPAPRTLLRQHGVGEDDFVVLWCGGYNTWTDVETLFLGLEAAMASDAKVRYVSVGANTYDAPDNTYTRFLKMIEGSAFRQRFVMLGWRPWREVAGYYAESDIGINIDAMHYELIYGTRTRLVEMIGAGLPVITTTGAELSYLLRQHKAALTFEIGDWRNLGEQLAAMAGNRNECRSLARRGWDYARSDLSFAKTTEPLRQWVQHPQHAPDRQLFAPHHRLKAAEHRLRMAARMMLWHVNGAEG